MPASTPDDPQNWSVFDRNDVKRVEIGQLTDANGDPTGDYGISVTAPDGTTEIIDGVSDVLTIVASGTISSPAVAAHNAGSTNVNVTTGLTYAPLCQASLLTAGNSFGMPDFNVDPATGLVTQYSRIQTIDLGGGVTQVRLVLVNGTATPIGAGAFTYRYYLLRQIGE